MAVTKSKTILAYDSANDELNITCVLETDGQAVVAAMTSCALTVYNGETGATLFSVADGSFTKAATGLCYATKATPGMVAGVPYIARATIVSGGNTYISDSLFAGAG
jgi:hypothetical protein